ncbi:MAG TPA: trypsin-like peptidase domain-containing protein [Chitinophagaceae bacterium]|nr:trypsin-like peptidase domain-containing protein [Chitinophagaceae bacterium]
MIQKNCILAALILMTGVKTSGQVISAEQNYAANSPAVAIVQTVFSAIVYVNKVEMNQRRFNLLVDSIKRLDTSGTMFSAEEKLDIVVKALYNSPFRFFSATTQYFRQRHRILSSGTGFFITGDGHLITNAHIIDRDSAFIRRKFTLSTFQEVTDANIRSLESSWEMVLNDEQKNLLNNAYSVIYSQVSSMILFDLKREIYVQFRSDNDQDESTTQRMPARLIIKGNPMPGKDIAVLKVDSVAQLPTLPINYDNIARIGEQVLVYGYPEPVRSNAFLARETELEPTLTMGIVSAVKRSIGGWPVIQMDALITHGSSGSPVCNNKGEVIGLATFGSLETNKEGLATGFNFAIPASIIRDFLDSVNIVPQMSRASVIFNKGLDFYYKGYYIKARNKFETVSKLTGNYPQLNYYLEASGKRLDAGEDRDAALQKIIFRIMAIVIVLGGVFIYYRWQRNKRVDILN